MAANEEIKLNDVTKTPPLQKKKNFPKISLRGKYPNKNVPVNFVCDKCETRFPSWWERREHWISSGHRTPEQCLWCKEKTFTLQSHICKQHSTLTSVCPYCGQMFMFKEDLDKHVLHHDGSEYRCTHCGRRRKDEKLLLIHVQNHFLQEKYGCNVCDKRFKKKKNLEKHLVNIHFICKYCGKTNDSKMDLDKHDIIHDDLKCVFCKKVFSAKTRLKYHYQLQHGHQDFYSCSQCPQRFAKRSILSDHLKLKHRGISNYTCEICKAPFLYWQQYQNHIVRHNTYDVKKDDEKFNCASCDFHTDLLCKLKWHVEKTSGLGFFCQKCKLRLDCRGKFDEHMKQHDGKDLWNCDFCVKQFKTDNRLRLHMVVSHPEEVLAEKKKVFLCPEKRCKNIYTSMSSLHRHRRTTHSNNIAAKKKVLVCPEKRCKKVYSSKTGLYEHRRKIHSKNKQAADKRRNYSRKHSLESNDSNISNSNITEKENDETDSYRLELNEDSQSDIDFNDCGKHSIEKVNCSPMIISTDEQEKNSIDKIDVQEDVIPKICHMKQKKKLYQSPTKNKKGDGEFVNINKSNEEEVDLSRKYLPKKGFHHIVQPLQDITEVNVFSCVLCKKFWFEERFQFAKHMKTHSDNDWNESCDQCNIQLDSPVEAVKHFVTEHLKVVFEE